MFLNWEEMETRASEFFLLRFLSRRLRRLVDLNDIARKILLRTAKRMDETRTQHSLPSSVLRLLYDRHVPHDNPYDSNTTLNDHTHRPVTQKT